uniref:Uncharacterized protein n=1 Tax=Pristionchus pacificus TaxID=54126 RepID=A0A2A6CTL5_PRIPA|eukprot:PDM81525.1 hypothetical protein PRIPAC_35401 [Pristionchus pacificus]
MDSIENEATDAPIIEGMNIAHATAMQMKITLTSPPSPTARSSTWSSFAPRGSPQREFGQMRQAIEQAGNLMGTSSLNKARVGRKTRNSKKKSSRMANAVARQKSDICNTCGVGENMPTPNAIVFVTEVIAIEGATSSKTALK